MPGIKIQDYRSAIKDVARPNRFLLTFPTLPTSTPSIGTFDSDMQYHVRTASLPGRTIGDITNLYWQGLNYKIAGDPTYDDYTIMFLNSANFKLKLFMEKWLNLIGNPVSNIRAAHGDYKAVIKLEQLGKGTETDILATYYLHGVYPKSMDPVELSHETVDAIEEFSVNFSVDFWSDNSAGDQGDGFASGTPASSAV